MLQISNAGKEGKERERFATEQKLEQEREQEQMGDDSNNSTGRTFVGLIILGVGAGVYYTYNNKELVRQKLSIPEQKPKSESKQKQSENLVNLFE